MSFIWAKLIYLLENGYGDQIRSRFTEQVSITNKIEDDEGKA